MNNVNEFTAQKAREIVAKDSYSTRGYVIDQIKKAARNGQTSIGISDLRLTEVDANHFKDKGFSIKGSVISWKE